MPEQSARGSAAPKKLQHSVVTDPPFEKAPDIGMPIGNLTSQLFANLYLDPLDHFVREQLRLRHYLRYVDDFGRLGPDRVGACGIPCRDRGIPA